MFQRFYTNTLESNYIKYILQNTHIPTIPFVENINHVTKNQLYIFEKYIVRAKQSEEVTQILYDIQLDRTKYFNYFERYDNYIFGKRYPGMTTNYVSNTAMYDPETHYYLGQYLKAYKAYYNIDLMPYYNCFSDEYISNVKLSRTTDRVAPYIKLTQESNINYKVISVPISFCKEYTIAIDSDQDLLCLPVFIGKKGLLTDLTDKLHATLRVAYDKQLHLKSNYVINRPTFKKPIYFHSPCIPGSEDEDQLSLASYEKYLRLLIQIPITNNSSIVILEGHYANMPSHCDREVNLDLNHLKTTLLNQNSIELEASNYKNGEFFPNYDKNAAVINSLICRNISQSIKACGATFAINPTNPNTNYYTPFYNLEMAQNKYPITISNVQRTNVQVIKSDLDNNKELDLFSVFGNSEVFVVGNSPQFSLKLNSTDIKSLADASICNKLIQVDQYTKLVYDGDPIQNQIYKKEYAEDENGQLIESNVYYDSDVLLSNGEVCLTFSKNQILKGQFTYTNLGITENTYYGPYNHNGTLTFTPNINNRLTGTLEIVDINNGGTYADLSGVFSYVIQQNNLISLTRLEDIDRPIYVTLQLNLSNPTSPKLILGYEAPGSNAPSTELTAATGDVLGEIIPEGFLWTHNDSYINHTLLTSELLASNLIERIIYLDEGKNYLQIDFKTPQIVKLSFPSNLPINHFALSQGIASEAQMDQYLNSNLLSNLSLLNFNDHTCYAFVSRLYEYLIGNVIDNSNKFEQNIKFVQNALKTGPSGIWSDDLRIKVYTTVQEYLNKYDLPNISDLSGFVDKDTEKILYTLSK